MRVLSVSSNVLSSTGRLDAKFHLSEGSAVAARMHCARKTLEFRQLGGEDGIGRAWYPTRFKRIYAVLDEDFVPYLRPYDVFSYLPRAADRLSATRSHRLTDYRISKDTILMTCSGRNLGPAVITDAYLAQFVLSHDMIRLKIEDETLRLYVLGYLATTTAQHLLRRDKGGSVIDHITPNHVSAQKIPLLPEEEMVQIASLMKQSVHLREASRVGLSALQADYENSIPAIERRRKRLCQGWTVRSRDIRSRMDAAPYDPVVVKTRKNLLKSGGHRVDALAEVQKPGGRYRTLYVTPEHGLPLLSGAQVLQFRPINLSFMPEKALRNVDRYRLRAGWIAYQADGRAEESLGEPVIITRDRDGWLASGHIGRVIAKDGVEPGHLWMALRTAQAQIQIKAAASGSVVDSTFPADIEEVVLPPLPTIDVRAVMKLWDNFVRAQELEAQAVALIEASLDTVGR
ncbi:MAG: restriction endonuclease subunit S [Phycisphaeraceae bacterium]|nr:restriction endonuclease subunit S [Phycisphaeraceae bacterium]